MGCRLVCAVLLGVAPLLVSAADIRVSSPLTASADVSSYTARIENCGEALTVKAGALGSEQLMPSDSFQLASGGHSYCDVDFTLEGAGRFSPSLVVARLDGSSNSLQESFQIESNAPTLLLSGVGISGEAGNQRLDVSFTVGDDTDVAYLSIDAAGLRASVLRASGGVVKNAREQAFAETPGGIRVYPDEEGQNDFVLSLPVNSSLEQAAVLSDALVLVEAHVVDSSGNQTSLSEISFVGDDVNEEILGFQVAPASIVFSNPLEEAQLVPSLEFQFRGLTPVPGRGKGVSYQSSDPGAVYVSDSGTIYPLKETPDGPVAITVTYSGQESVVVPVTVDYSKVLEKLKVEGLSEGLPFVLASLNHAYDMPSLLGVFDDGSSSPLTSSHKLSISVPEGADGLLDIDQGTVTASTEIPESSPVNIDISLLQYPGVGVQMPIVAEDALPSVNLQVEEIGRASCRERV